MGQTVSFDELRRIALETQRGAPVEERLDLNTHQWAGRTYDDIRTCLSDHRGEVSKALIALCSAKQRSRYAPLDQAVEYVKGTFGPDAVGLDLGCGRGQFVSEALARTDMPWIGTDKILYLHWKLGSETPEDELARTMQQAYAHAPADHFLLQDIQNMAAVPDNAVHLITSHCAVTYTLETKTLEEVERVLAPGGVAILTVPNPAMQRNVYAERGTTRDAEFSTLRSQGYRIAAVPGMKNDFCIMQKQAGMPPMRFAPELTDGEMLLRYSGEFRP